MAKGPFHDWLRTERRFREEIIRTDHGFASAQSSAGSLAFSFGETMRRAVLARGSAIIPE